MRKLLILLVVLAGCTTVPVKQTFPVLPEQLNKSCQPLQLLDSKNPVTLSQLLKVVAANYSSSNECAAKLSAILEWYSEQKKIFEDSNK